jgi:hypothetical protein
MGLTLGVFSATLFGDVDDEVANKNKGMKMPSVYEGDKIWKQQNNNLRAVEKKPS